MQELKQIASVSNRKQLSKKFGINGESGLTSFPFFLLTKDILYHPMHILRPLHVTTFHVILHDTAQLPETRPQLVCKKPSQKIIHNTINTAVFFCGFEVSGCSLMQKVKKNKFRAYFSLTSARGTPLL